MRFQDRAEAGARLAEVLAPSRAERPVVIGLTRGGVPVAAAVADALDARLDVLVVRKLGAPDQPELGLGAIAEGGGRWIDTRLTVLTGTSLTDLARIERGERGALAVRVARYRARHPRAHLEGRTVIVVDDGIATAGTLRAALASIRAQAPRRVILAVPVASAASIRAIAGSFDAVVCLDSADDLASVGPFYLDFSEVRDEDVEALLAKGSRRDAPERPILARAS